LKIEIDYEKQLVSKNSNGSSETYPFDTEEAFELIADAYIRLGWDNKYVYSFTWMGRPIIQLPEDMIRAQELIYEVKPDILIEIGVAHGGSLVYYAGLMKAMGKGRVLGVDIEIREHNKKEILKHELSEMIALIEGSSIDQNTVNAVRSHIAEGETVMIFLDGNHTYEHVLQELNDYSAMVTKGSYIVAMDGIQRDLVGAPRSKSDWGWNNAANAAEDFVSKNNESFVIEKRVPIFNEGNINNLITYWPSGYIKRI
jgi:cephalosporin hydroxylase